MTRDETAKIMAVISSHFPNKFRPELASVALESWHDLLSDLEYTHANSALRSLLHSSQFAPTVADIRRTVLEIQRGPTRTGAEAWGDVLREVSRSGSYREPSFSDPIVAQCVAAFGWQTLCLSENATADRARFIEAYEAMAQQNRREQQSPVLAAAREQRAIGMAAAISNVLKLRSGDA